MLLIKHRVNTIEELKATPNTFGVEADIRPEGNKLILHHDPFVKGEDFEEFLKHYSHNFLIANIKSEGIEQKTIEFLEKHAIKNYFLLDVSFPFMIKLVEGKLTGKPFKKLAVRFSEYESIDTCLALRGKVEWLFVDVFTKLPLDDRSHGVLSQYFKICLVSPEILGRAGDIQNYKKLLNGLKIDAVLTKMPEQWQNSL